MAFCIVQTSKIYNTYKIRNYDEARKAYLNALKYDKHN